MDAEKTYLAELAQCHENLRRAAETIRERDERIDALQAKYEDERQTNIILTGQVYELNEKLPHWLSVKQPPKQNGLYEVFDHDNGVHCAEYRKGRLGSEWTDDEGWCNFRVTHWRELPKPPQEEQDGSSR